jgi:hypothetical protein
MRRTHKLKKQAVVFLCGLCLKIENYEVLAVSDSGSDIVNVLQCHRIEFNGTSHDDLILKVFAYFSSFDKADMKFLEKIEVLAKHDFGILQKLLEEEEAEKINSQNKKIQDQVKEQVKVEKLKLKNDKKKAAYKIRKDGKKKN